MSDQEFILPSGKFCKIRKAKAGDIMLSMAQATSEIPFLAILLARIVTIDDAQPSPLEYMDLDAQDHLFISNKMPRLDGPVR